MTEGTTAAHHAPRRLSPPTPRVALVLAATLLVAAVLYLGREALTPFIVGALLIFILDPAVSFVSRLRIGRWQMPRGLAVLIVYIAAFFIVVEALALLLGPLVRQLLDYVRDLPRLLESFNSLVEQIGAMYRSLELPPQVRDFVDQAIAGLAGGAGQLDFGSLLPIARSLAGAVAAIFGYLIIPIWAFYLLRDRVRLTEQFGAALPAAWRKDVWAVLNIIQNVFGRWIRAQLVLGLIVAAATYVGLLSFGWFIDERFLQFAVLLAVIAGVLELLPIIGPIISMIPTLLLALTTGDPFVSVIAVVLLYLAIQQIEGAVLVPKIQGDALELHPSVVIFVLIVGGAIAGIPGAILSIPVTAAAKSVYKYLFRRINDEEVAAGSVTAEAAGEADIGVQDDSSGGDGGSTGESHTTDGDGHADAPRDQDGGPASRPSPLERIRDALSPDGD